MPNTVSTHAILRESDADMLKAHYDSLQGKELTNTEKWELQYCIDNYLQLTGSWQEDIKKGFDECMRVLDDYGVLIFKWNEHDVKLSDVLKVINHKPLFGHTTGRQSKTIWMCFMKIDNNGTDNV